MNARGKIPVKENKSKITASVLMRAAGVSAMVAGPCFIVIGMYHPVNVPGAVTTATWVNIHIFAAVMGLLLYGWDTRSSLNAAREHLNPCSTRRPSNRNRVRSLEIV